jgi:hypothetical protein
MILIGLGRLTLAGMLVTSLVAQSPAPISASSRLKLVVLEGKDAVVLIPATQPINLTVEVRDENDIPVEGADVTFDISASGAGGLFANGKTQFATRTAYRGQAAAEITPNSTTGPFSVKVSAVKEGRTGEISVRMTSTTDVEEVQAATNKRPWYKSWKVWTVVGVAAAGAVTGIVLATGSDKTITVTPGAPSVGGPR